MGLLVSAELLDLNIPVHGRDKVGMCEDVVHDTRACAHTHCDALGGVSCRVVLPLCWDDDG
jgi:hypothetical protein